MFKILYQVPYQRPEYRHIKMDAYTHRETEAEALEWLYSFKPEAINVEIEKIVK